MNSARREDGQSLIVVVIFLFLVIGMAGIVIDVAELYLTQRHLQSAADSAALAAAQDLPDSSLAACTYSASGTGDTCANGSDPASTMTSNGMNYRASFGSIQTTATLECLSVASAGTQCRMGDACPDSYQPAGGDTNLGCNAIKVREETTVKPFFMGAFGFGGTKVSATATASIAGGAPHPLNVEIIDDTTPSMQTRDTCGGVPTDVPASEANDLTQEDCAKAGIRSLLTELTPCYPPAVGVRYERCAGQGGPGDIPGVEVARHRRGGMERRRRARRARLHKEHRRERRDLHTERHELLEFPAGSVLEQLPPDYTDPP